MFYSNYHFTIAKYIMCLIQRAIHVSQQKTWAVAKTDNSKLKYQFVLNVYETDSKTKMLFTLLICYDAAICVCLCLCSEAH